MVRPTSRSFATELGGSWIVARIRLRLRYLDSRVTYRYLRITPVTDLQISSSIETEHGGLKTSRQMKFLSRISDLPEIVPCRRITMATGAWIEQSIGTAIGI